MIPALAGVLWLLPCAWRDAKTGRLPHPLTLTGLMLACGVRIALIARLDGDWLPLGTAAVVGYASLQLHWRGRLGGGDVPVLTGLALLSPMLLAAGCLTALLWQAGHRFLEPRSVVPQALIPPLLAGWTIAAGILCATPVLPGFCPV